MLERADWNVWLTCWHTENLQTLTGLHTEKLAHWHAETGWLTCWHVKTGYHTIKRAVTDMLKLADIMKTLSWLELTAILTCWHVKILKNALTWHAETGTYKTRSCLGLTGILNCWLVKIGSHFEKWADWHTETGRHNKNLLMTWTDWYTDLLTC